MESLEKIESFAQKNKIKLTKAARFNNCDELAEKKQLSFRLENLILFRSVFRTQSNIYDEAFCENS